MYRISFNDQYVGNNTDSEGHVVFTFDSYTYDLVFKVGFKDDGSILPHTFSGTRVSITVGSIRENVSGEQTVAPVTEPFADTTAGVTSAWVIGVFGLTFSMVTFIYDKIKQAHKESADRAVAAAKTSASQALGRAAQAANLAVAPNPAAGDVPFQLVDYKNDIVNSMKKSIQQQLDGAPPPPLSEKQMTEIRTQAVAAGLLTVEQRARDVAKGNLGTRLGPYVNILGQEKVNELEERVVQDQVNDAAQHLTQDSAYMKAVTLGEVFRFEQNQARTRFDNENKAIRALGLEIENAKGEVLQKNKEEQQYLSTLKEEQKTAEALAKDTRYQELLRNVREEEQRESDLDSSRDEAQDRAKSANDDSQSLQDRLDEQEREAKKNERDVFR